MFEFLKQCHKPIIIDWRKEKFSEFSIRNPYIKFQDSGIHHSHTESVMSKRTNARMDEQTKKLYMNAQPTFSELGACKAS